MGQGEWQGGKARSERGRIVWVRESGREERHVVREEG